jgi:phosphoribosylformylglycinamidine synthase
MYDKVAQITGNKLAHSLHTPGFGGLAVGFAKVAAAGRLGMAIDLSSIPQSGGLNMAELLYSESNTRFIMTASPEKREEIAAILKGVPFARVGTVTGDDMLKFRADGEDTVFDLNDLVKSYKSTLAGI